MSSWVEKDFEEKMTPHIDDIYHDLFPDLHSIKRSERSNNDEKNVLFMDKELAIDTIITLNHGASITLQEKTLHFSKSSFNALTIEFMNDPNTNEKGDWFHLRSQLYFFGYANKDLNGYYHWWLFDVAELMIFINKNIPNSELKGYIRQNYPPSKSSFFALPIDRISNNKTLFANKYKEEKL